jgi:hypothetical protein
MIVFRMDGAYTVRTEWCGHSFEVTQTRGAPTAALCRLLVKAGCPDQPWECWDATTGKPRFHGRSIHGWARKTISETDRDGLAVIDWRPPPGTEGATQDGAEEENR